MFVCKKRDENTWEPEENLNCKDLIINYEAQHKGNKSQSKRKTEPEVDAKKKKRPESTSSASAAATASSSSANNNNADENQAPSNTTDDNPLRGFDRGLLPEMIIGATDSSGELMFLMKWKNSDEADLVLAKTANVKCPQVVIQFYEERLTWHTGADDKDEGVKA